MNECALWMVNEQREIFFGLGKLSCGIAFMRLAQKKSPSVYYPRKGSCAAIRCSNGKLKRKQHTNKIKLLFSIH